MSDDLFSETQYTDDQLEHKVLSAAFVRPDMLDAVLEEAAPQWFYSETRRKVLRGLKACVRDGVEVFDSKGNPDTALFKHVMDEPERLYCQQIIDEIPTGASWRTYLERVQELYTKRLILRLGTQAAVELEEQNSDDVLDELIKKAVTVRDQQPRKLDFSFKGSTDEAKKRADRVATGGISGYHTGFPSLDNFFGGAVTGQNGIIAGRPGEFKSTLATEIGYHLAHQGIRTYMYSTEMRKVDYQIRIALGLLGLDSSKMKEWTTLDMDMYKAKLDEIAELPFYIDDQPGLTPARLKRRLRIVQPQVLIVDYVQRMKADSGVTWEYDRVSEVSSEVDGIKKELAIPVFTVAQLRRLGERENKEPDMDDLRGSGILEQDADWIMLLWRNGNNAQVNFKVPKNRFGPSQKWGNFQVKEGCAWLNPK